MTGTDLLFTHASLNHFQPAGAAEDVDRLTVHQLRHWITLTETTDLEDMVRRVVGHRYQVVKPDDGDITFLVHPDIDIHSSGGTLSIPGKPGPASKGGHSPRYNSWVRMRYDGQDVTHTGVHTVTVQGSKARRAQQVKQVTDMAAQMTRFGKGHRLATGSGDLNASLPHQAELQAIFDQAGLTTTAVTTGTPDPTHGDARLDYAWTRDADNRMVVRDMTVRHGPRWNSDHEPIDIWVRVRDL